MGVRVQGTGGQDGAGATSRDLALGSAATAGNLLVVTVSTTVDGATITSVILRNSGNTGDSLTLTRLANNQGGAVLTPATMWWGIVPSGAGTLVRIATSNTLFHYHAMEISGTSTTAGTTDNTTTGAVDGEEHAFDHATATSSDTGAGITTTQPGMQVALLQTDGNKGGVGNTLLSQTIGGSSATVSSTTARSDLFYLNNAATGTRDAQATWTTTQVYSTITASFEDAAGAAVFQKIVGEPFGLAGGKGLAG